MTKQNIAPEWTVIGAGAAGVTAVGQLLDHGIDAEQILWLDPHFTVGDLGAKWRNVSSNTKARLFLDYLNGCRAFNIEACSKEFALFHADEQETCPLNYIVEPLQWVTEQLQQRVHTIKTFAQRLTLQQRCWQIETDSVNIASKNVILAIGGEEKSLPFETECLPLSDVLDTTRLQTACDETDCVAVFGSSHSAILAIKGLLERPVKKVINFYLEPLRYAVELDDWTLFNDTGLKGNAAIWARENIDGEIPKNLYRYESNKTNLERYLPDCQKVVYSIGFEKRQYPIVSGFEKLSYNARSGIIAPGLFGTGIAFPEAKENPIGILEYRVGVLKFLHYLKAVMPIWLRYGT